MERLSEIYDRSCAFVRSPIYSIAKHPQKPESPSFYFVQPATEDSIMKLGLFGYPGDHLDRAKSVSAALKRGGADQIICLGGLVWSGRKGEEDQNPPATVLRWLRSEDIPTLCND